MTGPGTPGRLIALEGVDGSGKSTQARRLAEGLGAVLTREPGGTEIGTALRQLLLEPGQAPFAGRAEALLMAADRAQHVEEFLRPALAGGGWVVTDRYCGSTLAYQGFGRGLGVEALGPVLDFATDGLNADLNVLLDIPLSVARSRIGTPDRLERLDPEFFVRVRAGYLALAEADAEHWVVIDADRSPDDVYAELSSAVDSRLGRAPGQSDGLGTTAAGPFGEADSW